ncbi:MAG: GT4 family glycosyltransferase PelF [Anaerolineae bacterium]
MMMTLKNGQGADTNVVPDPEAATVGSETAQPALPIGNGASSQLSVLLVTEGTYPFQWGGVSTWCHLLMRDLPDVNFTLLSIVPYPDMEPLFTLPPNVVAFHPVPLWGVLEAVESQPTLTLSEIRQRKGSATRDVVAQKFLPIFRSFLIELLTDDTDSTRFGQLVHEMYRYFLTYDFDATLRSEAVWDCFGQTARDNFPAAARQIGYPAARFDMADVTWAMKWLYHWLFPLSRPIPRTDVVHTAMTGICSLVAAAAKYEHNAAFMLTEHGIYLRERYLAEASSSENLFLKLFKLRFARRTTELGYALADQISPCCDYNQRWEYRNGATREQVQTIYYGVDEKVFVPMGKPFGDPPVVVWVGRINPLKDVFTLIRAAAIVHKSRPDIEFRLFGSPPSGDEPYYEECLALRAELGLEHSLQFAGYTANTAQAYNQGDIAILSSVSEGFPFSTLEAMLCGKPVVATAVGGVPEQIEGCGIAVEPRNPVQLAEAVLSLVNDPARCAALGQAARAKAVQEFSVHQSGEAHRASYLRLASHRTDCRVAQAVPAMPAISVSSNGNGKAGVSEKHGVEVSQVGANGAAGVHSGNGSNGAKAHAGSNGTVLHTGVGGGNGVKRGTNGNGAAVTKTAAQTVSNGNGAHASAVVTQQHGNGSGNGHALPANGALLAALVADIETRVPRPIDSLEITAVLESIGITDEVARQYYGMEDTFALALAVLQQLRKSSSGHSPEEGASPQRLVTRREALSDYSRGPLALIPGFILLLFIQFCGTFGQWGRNEVLALSIGLTSSMVASSGIIQAVMRRASISLSMGNLPAMNRFLRLSLGWAFVCIAILGALAAAAIASLGVFSRNEALIFGLAFIGLSALWLPAAALTVVRAQWWLGAALAAGLLAGILAAWAIGPLAPQALAASVAVGFAVALGVVLGAVYFKLAKPAPRNKHQQATLPPRSYLINEAAPYFAYGSLYMVLILTPHILGWIQASEGGPVQWWAVSSLELGLTLSLPPIMLAGGVIEHALRRFWLSALTAQSETPGAQPELFRGVLTGLYRRHLAYYLAALTLMSAVVLVLFELSLNSGRLDAWLGVSSPTTLATVFYCGLIAYALIGWGLYNSAFSITLNLPRLATWGIVAGIIVTGVIGLTVGPAVDYRYTAVSFIVGAMVFVIVSTITVTRLLRSADYHYSSSF